MGCVYFSIPVVGGYAVMQWAISKSHESIGERGELLRIKEVQGLGDRAPVDSEEELTKIGAGGKFGGVKLAVSDDKTQQQNKLMLEAFFREQRKRRKKQEKKTEESETDGS